MSKSASIQHKYREISVDPLIVNNFSTEDQMHFSPLRQSDELLDLMQELAEHVREIIETQLTDRQREVVEKIYYEQMTQTEVAQELGLCQPTIHKVIFGNLDYQHGGKRYGGALKKLRKLAFVHPGIQKVLARITELKRELLIE